MGKSSITFDYQRIPVQDEPERNDPHDQQVSALPLARRAPHEQSFAGSLGTGAMSGGHPLDPRFLQVMLWFKMPQNMAGNKLTCCNGSVECNSMYL